MSEDTWLDDDAYLRSVERDAATIAAIADIVPLDSPVPSCPGWDLRDLIVHTGIVHRHKAALVRDEWVDDQPDEPHGPMGADLIVWFEEGVADLVTVLRNADVTKPSWTWCTHEHPARWWIRRMAHETAIHRADAELAGGLVPELDQMLAIDGADEVINESLVGGPEWGTVTPGDRVFALRAGGRTWGLRTATFSGTSPRSGQTYTDLGTFIFDDAEPEMMVDTDGSTLDLWLWGRGGLPSGAVSGDKDLVAQVREIAAQATQ
jgi:uncharacterized protein (TIGR03083 family)